MNIGYDAKRAFKNFTGLGNYSRAVIDIMANYYPQNNYVLYTPPYSPQTDIVFTQHPNINICKPSGLYSFFNSYWRSFKTSALIKRDKIDVYHGLSHELPGNILKSGARSVVTMHDLIVLRYPHLYKALDRKIYLKKYKHACSVADIVIAISQQTKADLINMMGVPEDKIRLVYQGCDKVFKTEVTQQSIAAVKAKYRLPKKYIFNVGTIETRKNLLTVIKALTRLPKDFVLVAAGKPTEYMQVLNDEINKNNLQNRVIFLHGVPFADLPVLYAGATVFVYPSVFEGFGIPILEAMNMKVPVIAANTSSLPEVGGDAAIYILPEDYEQLAVHINNIYTDSILQQTMIRKGLERAKKFNDENIAHNLNTVYTELI